MQQATGGDWATRIPILVKIALSEEIDGGGSRFRLLTDDTAMPDHSQFRRQSVSDALAWIDRWAAACATEEVALAEAAGRRLADRRLATTACPQQTIAALDGYALIAAGTVGASDYSPLPHRLVEKSRPLRIGEALLLDSGEALPDNADAVIDPALAERHGRTLEISGCIAPGDGVIAAGEEVEAGTPLLEAGRRLRPQDLAWLALAGFGSVPVIRRPRVRILITGRCERDANGPMLAAAVARDGSTVTGVQTVADPDALVSVLSSEKDDLYLVVGGTGQGTNDFSAAALSRIGSLDIRGIAMNPGEGVALGRVGDRPTLVLPGLPLACLCAYDLLGSRLVGRMAGNPDASPYASTRLPLARKVASAVGRFEICRVRVRDGYADPLATAENRLLATAVRADGFLLIPENSEGFPPGASVTVHLYEPTAQHY